MTDADNQLPEPLPEFASEWLSQRRIGFARLEQLRQEELRAMTETEAARVFAQLDPPQPYELRPSSGLVEQQRWFERLHDMTNDQVRRECTRLSMTT